MNREIKLRAWEHLRKKWIYGKSLCLRFDENDKMSAVFYDNEGNEAYLRLYEYTGLKDKHGKEIYEGDVLSDDCGELHEVVFGKLPLDKSGDCVCTYEAFYCKCYGKLGQAPFYECQNIGEWMEIIGNIYENPELLT